MKENAIQKINRMGKAGTTIAKIIKVCLIIGVVGCLIGGIVTLVLPKNLVEIEITGDASITVHAPLDMGGFTEEKIRKELESENISIDTGNQKFEMSDFELIDDNTLKFTGNGYAGGYTLRGISLVCFMAMLVCAGATAVMYFIQKLCEAFRDCESPFEEVVIKRLKRFAYSLIPFAVINSIAQEVTQTAMSGFTNSSFSLDMSSVLVILSLLALAYIFQYGAMLQQESDETL